MRLLIAKGAAVDVKENNGRTPLIIAADRGEVPVDKLLEYGRYRAEAMTIRDTKAAAGGVTEADWHDIQTDLLISWQSLWKAVQPDR